MMLIAAYDIVSDSRRARVAAILQSTGDRIQKSVFLLRTDETNLPDLTLRLSAELDHGEDSLYLMRQCLTCWDTVTCIGQAQPPEPCLYWAVL